MRLDTTVPPIGLREVPAWARAAEAMGFHTLWSTETQHDPFLPLALIAEHTSRVRMGTAIAVAFARSPGALAYTAWDLAAFSAGRMILGLGTQVKAHIERRFGLPWPASPVKRLREMVLGMRALWRTWQRGERLNLRGETLKLSLMTPFFNPGPIDHPHIPIFLAGVNRGLCRLAGQVAEGLHAHPYHSVEYLRQVVMPAVQEGLERSGRQRKDFTLSVTPFVVTDEGERDFVRSQIAFYASTPSYRPVMALHGWGEVADRLQGLVRRGRWGEMSGMINDQMLETFAVVAPAQELAAALLARYQGLADQLTLYTPFIPGQRDAFWRGLVEGLRRA
jgi:probable F420-dependent oxidoreductase